MTIGEKLRGLREDRDLNQSQIGKILNMGQKKISRIENNMQPITADELKSFCILYNVSSDWILELPPTIKHPKRK